MRVEGKIIKVLSGAAILCVCYGGCSKPPGDIPGIPKDHPANQFYFHAAGSMLSDNACRKSQGNPDIPMGEILQGKKYTKLADLAPGVCRFRENATGKIRLGVSYMKWEAFLQMPKLCSWEEKQK